MAREEAEVAAGGRACSLTTVKWGTTPGGVTEIIFNSRHPAYEKLVKTLDVDVAESSYSELSDRIQNASDTLRLIFAAWARYEEEDVFAKKKLREIRSDWGRMAEDFLEI